MAFVVPELPAAVRALPRGRMLEVIAFPNQGA